MEIPDDFQKDSLLFLRVHDDKAEKLGQGVENKNDYGEYYTISPDKKYVIFNVRRFSIYAMSINASLKEGSVDNSSHISSELDFWNQVKAKIETAKSNQEINIDVMAYDRLPYSIIETLKKYDVKLIIN